MAKKMGNRAEESCNTEEEINKNIDSATDEKQTKRKLAMPIAGLALDVGSLLFILLSILLLVKGGAFFIVALLLALLMPVAGIVMGIMAIAELGRKLGKAGMTMSVLAIALPIAVVIATVSLFFMGNIVIGM